MESSVPGFDLIVLRRRFDPETSVEVLRAAWAALAPGGVVCIAHPVAGVVGRLLQRIRVLPYTRYTRTQLLDLARRAASQHAVAEIPSLGVAFDLVAIRRRPMCT